MKKAQKGIIKILFIAALQLIGAGLFFQFWSQTPTFLKPLSGVGIVIFLVLACLYVAAAVAVVMQVGKKK